MLLKSVAEQNRIITVSIDEKEIEQAMVSFCKEKYLVPHDVNYVLLDNYLFSSLRWNILFLLSTWIATYPKKMILNISISLYL